MSTVILFCSCHSDGASVILYFTFSTNFSISICIKFRAVGQRSRLYLKPFPYIAEGELMFYKHILLFCYFVIDCCFIVVHTNQFPIGDMVFILLRQYMSISQKSESFC